MKVNLRKLAAIDVYYLGRKITLTEYACEILLSPAIGIFVLLRTGAGRNRRRARREKAGHGPISPDFSGTAGPAAGACYRASQPREAH